WSASDRACPALTWRVRRPPASASTPITSAPAPAGSLVCSRTNTRPVACSATAPVMVLHPASAGCGRWATTSGQVPGSKPVRVTSGARGVKRVAAGGGGLPLGGGALLRILSRLCRSLVGDLGGLIAAGVAQDAAAQSQRLRMGFEAEGAIQRQQRAVPVAQAKRRVP